MKKEIIKGYKFRIHPTEEQKNKIDKTFNACNYVYNGMLALRQFKYKEFNQKLSKFDLTKLLTQVKIGDDWLNEFDSKALAQSVFHMDRAYDGWIKQLKKAGIKYSKKTLIKCKRKNIEPRIYMAEKYPKFKSKKNPKQSYTTLQLRIADGKINLPKIGKVKMTCYDKRFCDWYQESECTVSKAPNGKYYASLLVKEEIEVYEQTGAMVGVDLGVKTFATTSENEFYQLPKKLWQHEARAIFLQKKLSRQVKGSGRYEKTRILLAKQHEKVANIRSNFLHNLSTNLIKENQLIALEDLNVKGMMANRKLAKAIGRMGFNQFKNMIESKAKWHDREVKIVDRWFPSSKTCSNCGSVKKDLKLLDRTYKCDNCGLEIDRDYNASINILKEAINN